MTIKCASNLFSFQPLVTHAILSRLIAAFGTQGN